MIVGIIIAAGVILIIIWIRKANDGSYRIKVDAPNPEIASIEKQINFIDERFDDVIKEWKNKCDKNNLTFSDIVLQAIDDKLNHRFNKHKYLTNIGIKDNQTAHEFSFDTMNESTRAITSIYLSPKKNIEKINNVFARKKIVITGIFDNFYKRDEIATLLYDLGADIDTSITDLTDYVIIGDDYGPSKIETIDRMIK